MKQAINKVCSKSENECDQCQARNKRKHNRGKKRRPRKDKRHRHEETDEEGEITSSSSSSSMLSSSSSDASSSDGSSDNERAVVTRARTGKKKDKKNKKLKSRISEKSCCADIEQKCKWPSSMLDSIFEGNEIPFKDLTMAQFLYGELCIWERPRTKPVEIKARQYLLKKMVKNEPKLGFEKSKEIYKTFLMRVEKGSVIWKNLSDIDRIETEVVLKCINLQEKSAKPSKFDLKKNQKLSGAKSLTRVPVHRTTIMINCFKARS